MSRVKHSFVVSGRPRVEIKLYSGDVRIIENAGSEIAVTLDGAEKWLQRISVDQLGDDTVRVEAQGRFGFGSGVDALVAVPAGSNASLMVGSSDVVIDVELGDLGVGVGSGDVRAGSIRGNAEVKAGAGDVHIDEVRGDLDASVGSGDIRVRQVLGDGRVKGASGDILLEKVAGRVDGSTAAGDITIRSFDGGDLRLNALSGDVTVGIPAGRTLTVELQTMTGDVVNELATSTGERTGKASLRIKTLSGDIRLKPAT